LAEVRWGDHRAIIDIDERRGVAWDEDEPLRGADLKAALDDAHGKWVNDSFWLNPVAKAVDPGTRRERVVLDDGGEALLVRYVTGGRTPGDAYLWLLDPSGRPNAWRMWVSILPLGGVRATWEGWIRLETDAWVSTLHETALFDIELTNVRGASSLEALVGADPFAPLADCSSTAAPCGTF
jgi:hypothetical protein